MKTIHLLALMAVWLPSGLTAGEKADRSSAFMQTHDEIARDLLIRNRGAVPSLNDQQGFLLQQAAETEHKSPGLAVLYSLLLPGMGELYAGDYGAGKYFTIAEGVLAVGAIGLDRYGNWIKDDARQYAVTHAHSGVDGKDDLYFSVIGDYQSVYEYNEAVLRSRDPQKVYDPHSSSYWSWDTPGNREQYRHLRVSSDERFNDARFVVAAIAVNHIVSAINAARIAIRHNGSTEESGRMDIHAGIIGGIAQPEGIRVTLSRNF